jgi:hypothetical protein
MKFSLHPDNKVIVHNDDGSLKYIGSPEEFALEFGQSLPPLPTGMASMSYDTTDEVLVYYDAKGNAFPREGRVDFACGKAAVAECGRLEKQMKARERGTVISATEALSMDVRSLDALAGDVSIEAL